MKVLTQAKLHELLVYNGETGFFTRRCAAGRWGRIPAGTSVGSLRRDGYVKALIDGKSYLAHRLAWFYVYGLWPTQQIDHINGIRSDNRIANLRDVEPSINKQNMMTAQRDNRLGVLGVVQTGEKFSANIKVFGEQIYLGQFGTVGEAHAAYLTAKRERHPGYIER